MDKILSPWPWYIAGPLIGLMVPLLLFLGNKAFGISSSLRHMCAATVPSNLEYFKYDWKKERWNLFFTAGALIGSFIAASFLTAKANMVVSPELQQTLSQYGIAVGNTQWPQAIFNWSSLFTVRGFIMMVVGGFMVGFGTRYAGGCTSGHSIMGLANLQWPSLVATICFMLGGFLMTHLLLPIILNL
ncbi:MAG: YeeE/YedE thiosulfate transporter family protein [Saprospiraceae bacterium]